MVWQLAIARNRSAYTDASFIDPVRFAVMRELTKRADQVVLNVSFCKVGAKAAAARVGRILHVHLWVAKPSHHPVDEREALARVLKQAMLSLNGASRGAIDRVATQPAPEWWRGFKLEERPRDECESRILFDPRFEECEPGEDYKRFSAGLEDG